MGEAKRRRVRCRAVLSKAIKDDVATIVRQQNVVVQGRHRGELQGPLVLPMARDIFLPRVDATLGGPRPKFSSPRAKKDFPAWEIFCPENDLPARDVVLPLEPLA
jgi:hypothetical protein